MCELLRLVAAVAIATDVTCRFGTTEKSLNYSFAMQVSLPRRMLAHARVLLTHCLGKVGCSPGNMLDSV